MHTGIFSWHLCSVFTTFAFNNKLLRYLLNKEIMYKSATPHMFIYALKPVTKNIQYKILNTQYSCL